MTVLALEPTDVHRTADVEVSPRRRRSPRVAILIAAHDEADCIQETLAAAVDQTHPLAAVVVMADNCTDDTAALARAVPGVTVIETVGNTHKKSGALNQAWALLRDDVDYFACLDADTVIPPDSRR